jgi:hypothetical protein
MRKLLMSLWFVAACDAGAGPDTYTEEGECQAPAGATDVGATPVGLVDQGCLSQSAGDLQIVDSQAAWDALFDCAQPLPAGTDLAAQRLAVVAIDCTPAGFRFAAETDAEVVVGVKTGISGACLGDVIVVPLPRSTKPVRLARCWDECHGECPPVP